MVKVIEARALLTADDQASPKLVALAKRAEQIAKASAAASKSGAEQFSKMAQQIEATQSKLAAMTGYRKMARDLDTASIAHRKAQQEANRMKAAVEAAGGAGGKLARDYDRAARAAENARTAFMSQGRAVRQSRAELEAMGIPVRRLADMERQLASQADRATAALKRQAAATASRAGRPSTPTHVAGPAAAGAEGSGTTVVPFGMKGLAPVALAYGANRVHSAIIDQHHDFQQAYLRQQFVLSLSKEGQQSLLEQAEKIGKDTKFSNADIVRAQSEIGGKLPDGMKGVDIVAAITESTKDYALAMEVSMEEGAEAIVGYIKSWGYDLSSANSAAASAKRAANILVQQAKSTGAKHHDLVGSTKFGAAPARAGGFSEELINSVQAQLIRVGYDGAMAGTFARAVATKLAVPSRTGAAAIAGAGIDYGQYQKPGVNASAAGLGEMLRQRFGRGLNKAQTAALQEVLEDPDAMASKGAFQEKAGEILNSTFARKTKAGKINAMDADRISKTTDQFYNIVSGGVDTPRLFMDLLKRGLTPALARYLFGQEHGGRAIGLDPKAVQRDWDSNKNIPENRASNLADKMQEGAQGEWNKLIGSVQTFGVALGEATDATRQWTYKGLGSLFDYLTDAVQGKLKPNAGITPLTGDRARWRLDTWHPDAAGMYERSMREQKERIRDPEGARGRAMMNLGRNNLDLTDLKGLKATVAEPIPVDVTGKVQLDGKATLTATIKVDGPGQVISMTTSSSGHLQTEGQALQGTFGRN